jgi:hypothetical protein
MQRKLIQRYYGSRRKDHAVNHSVIPFSYHLDAFALTAISSTILKTLYPAKIHIVIPFCVPGSVMNIMWN